MPQDIYRDWRLTEGQEQIRLLRILPPGRSPAGSNGFPDAIFCEKDGCSLLDVSLKDYTALSYTWGEPVYTKTLVIAGTSVPITENLHAALQSISKAADVKDGDVRVWVDFVCINQDDHREKTEQVAMMRDVYLCASSVFVWLGPGDEDTDALLHAIREAGDESSRSGLDTYFNAMEDREFNKRHFNAVQHFYGALQEWETLLLLLIRLSSTQFSRFFSTEGNRITQRPAVLELLQCLDTPTGIHTSIGRGTVTDVIQ